MHNLYKVLSVDDELAQPVVPSAGVATRVMHHLEDAVVEHRGIGIVHPTIHILYHYNRDYSQSPLDGRSAFGYNDLR